MLRHGSASGSPTIVLWPRTVPGQVDQTSVSPSAVAESVTVVPTAVRISVILLALAGTAGHLAYLDALWWHSLGLAPTVARNVSGATLTLLTAHAVVSVVCAVLGVMLVLTEHHRGEAARALGLAYGAWSYLMAYSGVTMLFRPPTPGLQRELFEAHFLLVEVLGLVGLLRFTSIFPRELTHEELRPPEALPGAFRPIHQASVFMRRPGAPLAAGAAVLALLWGWTLASGANLSDAGLSRAMDVARFCAAGLLVMNLRHAWSAATEGDRDGLTWLLVGLSLLAGSLSLLIGGNVLVAVTGFPEPSVAWRPILLDFGLVGFLTAVAMSVLSRGRADPGRALTKTATAAAAFTLGLFLAAGFEALFTGGIVSSFSFRSGVGTALAFAGVLSTYRTLGDVVARVLPL